MDTRRAPSVPSFPAAWECSPWTCTGDSGLPQAETETVTRVRAISASLPHRFGGNSTQAPPHLQHVKRPQVVAVLGVRAAGLPFSIDSPDPEVAASDPEASTATVDSPNPAVVACDTEASTASPTDIAADRISDVEAAAASGDWPDEQKPSSSCEERLPNRSSLRSVYLLNFLMVANFTVLVPKTTVYWEALGGDAGTGSALVRLLPLLKAVMAWAFLTMSFKRSVSAVISTMIAGNIIGNLVFALAPVTQTRWMILIARLVLTSHEVQSVPNCYIGRAVGLRHRSEVTMHNNAWFALGYAAGPVIAYILEKMVEGLGLESDGVDVFDSETVPGWFMACTWILFAAVHRRCYEEPDLESGEASDSTPTPIGSLNWVGILATFVITFVIAVVISSWEMWTLGMVQQRWGSPLVAGGYLAAVTISILPIAMISGRLAKLVDDRMGLLVAFIAAASSWAFLFQFFRAPYYHKRTAEILYYTCGSIGLLGSMQLARGFVEALTSKLSPPDRKQQLITATISIFMLGRGVGGCLGASFVNQNSWAGLHMSSCALTAVIILATFKFLCPHDGPATVAPNVHNLAKLQCPDHYCLP